MQPTSPNQALQRTAPRVTLAAVIRFVVIFLIAALAVGAESRGPFYSPVTGFAEALVPILSGFEKARVETTLRGFIARADSFPGFRQSDMEPSARGLYLNVAVRDAGEVKGFSDRTVQKGTYTHRFVQIPPPKGGEQAIVIQLDFGREVSADVVRAIDECIRGIVKFSAQPARP